MKTKRTQKLMAAALVGAITLAVTALHPAPAAAEESSESPLVRQMYNGQYPPNADIIYSMSYLDLKKTGPLIVNAPPRVIGMFTDFFQRTLTDVGAAGPDKGEGGLYLLLPPDYQGPLPAGYYTFRSQTYNVFLFFRTVLTQGPDGPDNKEPVAIAEMTRVYPWGSLEKDRPAMKFPNASNVPV